MSAPAKCGLFILVLAVGALALRLPGLADRPMHTDEAVQAAKFGDLLENRDYRYDPHEYHGPTLNYFTLVAAALRGEKTYTQISEVTLRIVPALFGVILILLLLVVTDGLTAPVAILAALLGAVSPAMVFYSRYYIMEILLITFTFGAIVAGYRYCLRPCVAYALMTGICLGLMHATKETCVIAYGAMFLSLIILRWWAGKKALSQIQGRKWKGFGHALVALAAAVVVSALCFSAWFTHPESILDSYRTYATYLHRAGHIDIHIHPWHYYLQLLLFFKVPPFTEALIVALAVVGFSVAMTGKTLTAAPLWLWRFLALYTLFLTAAYTLIPYKTPWCMLGFLHGMILLGALGAVTLIRLPNRPAARTMIALILAAGTTHLVWQSWLQNYCHPADSRYPYSCIPQNPYVYGHTLPDVLAITSRIEEIAQVHPQGRHLNIQVICPGADYWPLPWRLREFPNVAWLSDVPTDLPPAPIIIAAPELEVKLMNYVYQYPPPGQRELYAPLFDAYYQLRPRVELRGYVKNSLRDQLRQSSAPPPDPPNPTP